MREIERYRSGEFDKDKDCLTKSMSDRASEMGRRSETETKLNKDKECVTYKKEVHKKI